MIKTTIPFISNLNRLSDALRNPEKKPSIDKAMARVRHLESLAKNKLLEEGAPPKLAECLTKDTYVHTAEHMALTKDLSERNKIATNMAKSFRTLMS